MEIFEKVKEIAVDQLGVTEDKVKLESTLIEDLGADSLDVVEFIMSLEEKFDIEIPDDAAENITTIKDVVEFIKNKQ